MAVLFAGPELFERLVFTPVIEATRTGGLVGGRRPLSVVVPAPADKDSWIAYTRVGEDGSESDHVVTPDGANAWTVLARSLPGTTREWAADGARIEFCTTQDHWDGAGHDRCVRDPSVAPYLRTPPSLTYIDARPARSPDGRTLAFVRVHDAATHRAALMTADVLSGESTELVGFEANVGYGVDWSPDGNLVAYTANPGGGPTSDLWVVARDGWSQRLTHFGRGWTASSPTFSPDGKRIAISLGAAAWQGIAIVELAGTGTPTLVGAGDVVARELDWGPSVR